MPHQKKPTRSRANVTPGRQSNPATNSRDTPTARNHARPLECSGSRACSSSAPYFRRHATEPTDLTIEILEGIGEETHKTNERLDKTNDRLDELRLDVRSGLDDLRTDLVDRIERVERRQTETEMRLASELVAVGGAVREVRELLREDRALRDRVDDHERRLAAVERRTG